MQLFQSWIDIIIMLVVSIAYIITFIAQRNQIRVLKETIQSHSELTSSQATYIETFKKMFNPTDMEAFMNLKIEQAVINTKEEINKTKDPDNMVVARKVIAHQFLELSSSIYLLMKFYAGYSENERFAYLEKNTKYTRWMMKEMFKYYDKHVPAMEGEVWNAMQLEKKNKEA